VFAATAADGFFPYVFGAECFGGSFLEAALAALAGTFFALGLAAGFFAAVFGSSFFSVNSNAGFGIERSCGLMCVIKAAGFTPAAAAAFAADTVRAACFGFPSMSGLTIT
jgi:hypothetical protein